MFSLILSFSFFPFDAMNEDNLVFADIDADLHHFDELYPGITNDRKKQYYNEETFNELITDITDLKIFHLNIRTINDGNKYFNVLLCDLKCQFDFLCLTESWIHVSTKQLYHIPGYIAYRSLRPDNQKWRRSHCICINRLFC